MARRLAGGRQAVKEYVGVRDAARIPKLFRLLGPVPGPVELTRIVWIEPFLVIVLEALFVDYRQLFVRTGVLPDVAVSNEDILSGSAVLDTPVEFGTKPGGSRGTGRAAGRPGGRPRRLGPDMRPCCPERGRARTRFLLAEQQLPEPVQKSSHRQVLPGRHQ